MIGYIQSYYDAIVKFIQKDSTILDNRITDYKDFKYWQQIPFQIELNINHKGISTTLEIDTWCIENIGPEDENWRRFFATIWEFKREEDLTAFKLVWL